MHKRFIKLNKNDDIIFIFCDYQIEFFDGTEIPLDEVEKPHHKINGKSISNEAGAPIFRWDRDRKKPVEKSQSEIDSDPANEKYRKMLIADRIKEIDSASPEILAAITDKIINGKDIPESIQNLVIERKDLQNQLTSGG